MLDVHSPPLRVCGFLIPGFNQRQMVNNNWLNAHLWRTGYGTGTSAEAGIYLRCWNQCPRVWL